VDKYRNPPKRADAPSAYQTAKGDQAEKARSLAQQKAGGDFSLSVSERRSLIDP
jgi:hypothetical protein